MFEKCQPPYYRWGDLRQCLIPSTATSFPTGSLTYVAGSQRWTCLMPPTPDTVLHTRTQPNKHFCFVSLWLSRHWSSAPTCLILPTWLFSCPSAAACKLVRCLIQPNCPMLRHCLMLPPPRGDMCRLRGGRWKCHSRELCLMERNRSETVHSIIRNCVNAGSHPEGQLSKFDPRANCWKDVRPAPGAPTQTIGNSFENQWISKV